MKCEELEAIVFSGKEPTEEQHMQMQEHAKNCEACRALLNRDRKSTRLNSSHSV